MNALNHFDSGQYKNFTNPAMVVKDLQTLRGIVRGILADKVIHDDEYLELYKWIRLHTTEQSKSPYKEIIDQLQAAIADDVLTHSELEDIEWLCTQYLYKQPYYTPLASIQQDILGIINGISMDRKIHPAELSHLSDKLQEYHEITNYWPFNEVSKLVSGLIHTGIMTEDDESYLLNFFQTIAGYTDNNNQKHLVQSINSNYYEEDPDITIEGSSFCLTGVSKKMKRGDIAQIIIKHGGLVLTNVGKKLNYLIVCADKNSNWAYSSFGRKVEEVMQLRSTGHHIHVVHEFDLFDKFESIGR